jgi:hypothetical protein
MGATLGEVEAVSRGVMTSGSAALDLLGGVERVEDFREEEEGLLSAAHPARAPVHVMPKTPPATPIKAMVRIVCLCILAS